MWTVVNNLDVTANIDHDSIQIQQSLADPLPTASFLVNDPGCHLNLQFGQPVIIWDENAAPDHTVDFRVIETIPTLNILKNESFNNSGQYWTAGGTNSGLITYGFLKFILTFANTANTATGYLHQITPRGYVTAGTAYCLSAYAQAGGSNQNIAYWSAIKWLDAGQNVISTSDYGLWSPPDTQTYRIANDVTVSSAVAPAGAVYADVYLGAQPTVSGTNSGTMSVATAMLEPAWFNGLALGDGAPVFYPSPDCNNGQVTSVRMPDQTTSRACRLFAGYIKNLDADYTDGGVNRIYTVDCASYGDIIENGALINKSYANQTDAFIINDIVSTYFSGLLSTGQQNNSAPSTTLVAGQTVNEVSYIDQTFREVLNGLTDLTGFSFFVDPYGYVHYNDTPFDYAPFTLSDTPDNISSFAPQDYKVTKDGTQLRNSVKITGGKFQVTVTDQFNGDGATKVFNLSNIPTNINSITIGGSTFAPTSTNKIGTAGTDVNGTGGVVVLFDKQAQKLTFNTAPATGTNNVVVSYPTERNVVVLVEDNGSIALYGRKFTSKANDSALTSNATAKTRGEAEIAKYAYPLMNLTFKLYKYAAPGTTVLVTSSLDGFVNQPFVIQTVTASYLGGGTNLFDYEAGIYRPSLHDHLRNAHKAIGRNTSVSGTTTILQTYEIISDQTYYADKATIVNINTPSLYTVDRYGIASFG